jgi:hypothetical protein
VDSANNVYLVDSSARLRRVSPTGTISSSFPAGNSSPSGITADATNFYFTDGSEHVVRKVSPGGTLAVVAGTVQDNGFSGDGGPAISATLNGPQDVAIDSAGSLYIVDASNHRIRKVTVGGVISTVTGNGTLRSSGDGGPATSASLFFPRSVAVDTTGNLFISQVGQIRKVSPDGIISTVAGTAALGDLQASAVPLSALRFPRREVLARTPPATSTSGTS